MVSFKIEAKLPSLNDYINKLKSPYGKKSGAQFKRMTDDLCAEFMLPIKMKAKEICKNPVLILFKWDEKSHRRDLDNIASAKKFILDAMQKCGIIENDNYACIKGIYDAFVFGEKYFVTISIYSLLEQDKLWKDFTSAEKSRIANEIDEYEGKRK